MVSGRGQISSNTGCSDRFRSELGNRGYFPEQTGGRSEGLLLTPRRRQEKAEIIRYLRAGWLKGKVVDGSGS